MSTCLNCGHDDSTGFAFCPRCGTRIVESVGEKLDPLIGRTLSGKYRVEEKIGAGAMGTVYLGEHIGLKKKIALKILHPDLQVSDEALQRFQREGIAAGKFSHPHAIQIFDFDRGDGRLFYLAMEFVDGLNLTQFLKQRGRLPSDVAVHLAHQLVSCLAEAHRHGIVHRDLKPDNIMVTEDARGGLRLKVLDFGLSKLLHLRLGTSLVTQPGRLLGTPLYMAPEQVAGEEADARSDVYAAGLILYEMLAGVRPWHTEESAEFLLARTHREAPSIGDDHPDVELPEGLDLVIEQALQRSRADRYQTAEEMLEALDDVVNATVPPAAKRTKGTSSIMRASTLRSTRGVTRGATRRPVAAAAPASASKRRTVWIAAGAGAIVLAVASFFLFGDGFSARPARVRMIAESRRSADETQYVRLLDEARAAVRSKDVPRAMSAVEQARALPCKDAEALLVRGEAYAARGDVDTAAADFRAAAQADPTFAEPLHALGWLAFDRDDLVAAGNAWTEAEKLEPDSASVLAGRGAVAWRKGESEPALELLGRAVARDASSARAHLYLGRLRLERGEFDPAITALVEAKRADPRSATALAWLAEAYLARERWDDADAQLREALAIEPNSPDVRELRAALLIERGRNTEALEFLKEATERHPDRGRLWVLRGVALGESDVRAAIDALKRGIDHGAGDPSARTLLGVLYQRDGKLDEAISQYDLVLRDAGDVPSVNVDYGLALFAQKNYAGAAERFERAIAMEDDNQAAHYQLGLLQMDYLGDVAKARTHLSRYLELGGTDERVKAWLARLP